MPLFLFVQQAREMVLEIIREKDQADFRGVRGDFTSRTGGGGIEVSWTQASLLYRTRPKPLRGTCWHDPVSKAEEGH